jgi:hypothetical protein
MVMEAPWSRREYHSGQLAARGESTIGRVPASRGQMQGGATQAMLMTIVEERQRSRCPRQAGTRGAHGGCTTIAALLVVNDVPASPPPRALRLPRKPHARGPLYFHHGLLGSGGSVDRAS